MRMIPWPTERHICKHAVFVSGFCCHSEPVYFQEVQIDQPPAVCHFEGSCKSTNWTWGQVMAADRSKRTVGDLFPTCEGC